MWTKATVTRRVESVMNLAALGAIRMAAREELDNSGFVINLSTTKT